MPHGALLWVTADPTPHATLAEFQDWYDNEHVPLRMSSLTEFETGARYQATDGQFPGWSAHYEISDPVLFTQHKYTKLREHRSPREAELITRLGILDRRTYTEMLDDTAASAPPRGKKAAAPFLVTVASNQKPRLDEMREAKGWKRSHAYKLGDSLTTGHGKAPVTNNAPAYVALHEFGDDSFEGDPTVEKVLSSGAEVRRWKLWRAWDNTA